MNKKLGMTLSAMAVLAGSVITAPTASAASSSCASHYVCVWTDGGFNGSQWSASGYTSYVDTPSWMHDKGSSWANHNGSRQECIIDHVNGRRVYLDVLAAGVNRGVVPNGTNDRIDAVGWC